MHMNRSRIEDAIEDYLNLPAIYIGKRMSLDSDV